MKVTLSFDLPDERQLLFDSLRGPDWKRAWAEVYRGVRAVAKHGEGERQVFADEVRTLMQDAAPADWLEDD